MISKSDAIFLSVDSYNRGYDYQSPHLGSSDGNSDAVGT